MSLRSVFRRWIPLAGVTVGLCLLIFVSIQQSYRQGADDPQIQFAEDAVSALESGAAPASVIPGNQVDLGSSLAPWVTVYDASLNPVASSATLNGAPPKPPAGVFDQIKKAGQYKVTWQPERGVRMATVGMVTKSGGYVVAGRSLRETEVRESQARLFAALAIIGLLVASLAAIIIGEMVLGDRRNETT